MSQQVDSTCAHAFVPVCYPIPLTSEPSLLSADIRQKDKSAWWKAGDSFLHKQTKHDLTSLLHLRLPITLHISPALHSTEKNSDKGTVKRRRGVNLSESDSWGKSPSGADVQNDDEWNILGASQRTRTAMVLKAVLPSSATTSMLKKLGCLIVYSLRQNPKRIGYRLLNDSYEIFFMGIIYLSNTNW